MTHRHAIEQHMATLSEVRDIMAAMKNLALMEVRKLGRYHDNQCAMVQTLRKAAADFLGHYPLPPSAPPARRVYLLFGAERGFCGAFNESLRQAFDAAAGREGRCIAVGRRLYARMEGDPRLLAAIDGASVAEEATPVLEQLLAAVSDQQKNGPLALFALFHDQDAGQVANQTLLPPFADLAPTAPGSSHPPLLNLPAPQLLAELSESYLLAALYHIAYASLLAESQQRIRHLEAAVHRLEDRREELARRCRTLRQEEITEEIEVLLLNAMQR
ncbi:F0F1 ATP synthase subunit gamma [Methylogaea oryzae]|uniref:F0F1 ATP synthase subunit gamma n=1 Tax=Methylogaea oryzae TaxID=1295382 RepID=A0A8D5AL20_9GAMM|nr:FoF1 ATP synthase subunit gamma [Methylogaea oryzae]BBL72374.1 hypothetical protein MoryE10_29800 [Methylogaea oryzae]